MRRRTGWRGKYRRRHAMRGFGTEPQLPANLPGGLPAIPGYVVASECDARVARETSIQNRSLWPRYLGLFGVGMLFGAVLAR